VSHEINEDFALDQHAWELPQNGHLRAADGRSLAPFEKTNHVPKSLDKSEIIS